MREGVLHVQNSKKSHAGIRAEALHEDIGRIQTQTCEKLEFNAYSAVSGTEQYTSVSLSY